ncbi:MAG TPA: methyltransferase family protein [Candidatus Brocadiia bacterium]|nr:isoprenylcysteine carboxylmethyltransferase family protein [Candidatus Brocadiales bacterium]
MTTKAELGSWYASIFRQFIIKVGVFLFRWRNTVFFLVDFILIFSTRPKFIFGSELLDNCMDGVGFTVALSGQVLRALTIGHDYIKRGGRDKKIAADRLVTGGIFAHSRNPLYLGNILILIGLGIIYNSIWVYILGFSFFLFGYLAIVVAEESFLKEKFGAEYEAYCKRVPRFIPRFTGIRNTLSGGTFNWTRFLKKEYNLICIWVSSAIFLEIWEEFLYFGYASRKRSMLVLSLCLIPIFVFYCIVRYLKKYKKFDLPDT